MSVALSNFHRNLVFDREEPSLWNTRLELMKLFHNLSRKFETNSLFTGAYWFDSVMLHLKFHRI